MHCMTWYTVTCSIMAMGLLYRLHTMVKCVCMGYRSNSFVTKAHPLPIDGHYRTYIISGVGYPRSNSVVLLLLCIVVCNGWGTGIVILVHQDNANPAEKGKNFG